MRSVFRILAVLCLGFAAGCLKAPPTKPVAPTVPPPSTPFIRLAPENYPSFEDDADTTTLRTAVLQSIGYYRSRPAVESFVLAGDSFTVVDLAESLELFLNVLDQAPSREALKAAIRENFQIYQSVGTDPQRTVTFSSYYEPTIPARLKRTEAYRYPIYGRPNDLIDVDLGSFDPAYRGARIAGRRQGENLVPYHTRGDIDSRRILKDKAKILAWAKDPMDIFFMQIEGSGWLLMEKGKKVRIRYHGTNGKRYRSVGQYLLQSGRYPGKHLSHDDFKAYMASHPKERQSILNVNERYVFFRLDRSPSGAFAYGNIEVPLTPGRSIATDPKLFPKGSLSWIQTEQPVFDATGKKTGMAPLTRFVVSQDEGGAIQGPGRVDFFVGSGQEAHLFATNFWVKGTLYFLLKKKQNTPNP